MGATLYHALTGAPPPPAIDRLQSGDALSLPAGIPAPFATAVQQAQLRVDDRPSSVTAFLDLMQKPPSTGAAAPSIASASPAGTKSSQIPLSLGWIARASRRTLSRDGPRGSGVPRLDEMLHRLVLTLYVAAGSVALFTLVVANRPQSPAATEKSALTPTRMDVTVADILQPTATSAPVPAPTVVSPAASVDLVLYVWPHMQAETAGSVAAGAAVSPVQVVTGAAQRWLRLDNDRFVLAEGIQNEPADLPAIDWTELGDMPDFADAEYVNPFPLNTNNLAPSEVAHDFALLDRAVVTVGHVAMQREPDPNRSFSFTWKPQGTVVQLLGGPVWIEGETATVVWWYVETADDGQKGWMAANGSVTKYLDPLPYTWDAK